MADALTGMASGRAANTASNSAGDVDTSIWDKLSPASFEIPGYPKIILPTWNRVEKSHGIREVPREVPWVNGAQLDETGTKAAEWTTEHLFHNDLCEYDKGIGKEPLLYPDRLELFETILEQRKTGTLDLPWRRNIRCKAITWRRTATTEMFDCENLVVTWKEDNENKLENPSSGAGVHANLQRSVTEARFACEREGIWDGSWEDITLFASQLQAAVAAPGQFVEDVRHKANRVIRAVDSIMNSFQQAGDEARGGLRDASGSIAYATLFNLRTLAAKALDEALGGERRIVTWKAPHSGSIWSIAMAPGWEDQDPEDLLRDNPQIPDPNWISKGTPIRVRIP